MYTIGADCAQFWGWVVAAGLRQGDGGVFVKGNQADRPGYFSEFFHKIMSAMSARRHVFWETGGGSRLFVHVLHGFGQRHGAAQLVPFDGRRVSYVDKFLGPSGDVRSHYGKDWGRLVRNRAVVWGELQGIGDWGREPSIYEQGHSLFRQPRADAIVTSPVGVEAGSRGGFEETDCQSNLTKTDGGLLMARQTLVRAFGRKNFHKYNNIYWKLVVEKGGHWVTGSRVDKVCFLVFDGRKRA